MTAFSVGTLDDTDIEALRAGFRGDLVTPGHGEYDQARRVWNGNIDRSPGVIARCRSAADVQAAVNFARERSLVVAVRGGAHNAAGHGTCDGGIVIDLSPMKDISVDPAARTARVGAGVLWKELDAATTTHGLATTGGTVTNTGVAGLTLGGGLGWLMGLHGLTIDNLLSAQVVTADGSLRIASASQNLDLFWALRGGGGNFGIVTEFEFRLHPIPEQVLGGMVIHLLDAAPDVIRFVRDFAETLPDEAHMAMALLTAPGGPPVIAVIAIHNGPIAEGERVFAPLRAFGTPIDDTIGPMSYCARQALIDEPNAIHGLQRYWKSGFSTSISDELVETAPAIAATFTSPLSAVLFFRVNGAATRVPPDATAFALRQPLWDVNVIGQWQDPAESAGHIAWVRDAWARIEPHISGSAYVNHIAADDSPEKVRASYGGNLARLAAIKAQYDPTNLFRLNPNIQPA